MNAEMPCQGRLRLSDRNLRDTLGPVPRVSLYANMHFIENNITSGPSRNIYYFY